MGDGPGVVRQGFGDAGMVIYKSKTKNAIGLRKVIPIFISSFSSKFMYFIIKNTGYIKPKAKQPFVPIMMKNQNIGKM